MTLARKAVREFADCEYFVTPSDSCVGLRELDEKQQPCALLAQVEGAQLKEMNECEHCCGLGGDSTGSQSEFYESLWSSGGGRDVTLHIVRDKVVKHLIVQTSDRLAYLKPWRLG